MSELNFKNGEATIQSEAKKYSVALDWAHDYAALVGIILSMFAVIEDYPPKLLSSLNVMSLKNANTVMSTFRAFSNRIDLLHQLSRNYQSSSTERIVLSYFKGRFTEANKIRNKYAHAKYGYAKTHFVLQLFASDLNRKPDRVEMTLDDFKADRATLVRTISELHAACYRNEVPRGLHLELSRQSN